MLWIDISHWIIKKYDAAADAEEGRQWIEFCVKGRIEELARGVVSPLSG